ncbi:uncharacterized protein STEHIDRAFT_128208 [Stereum hirsutum FP-91666 SS1]|uniref:uncharacterized protein n=1 Tax=Stereum hirsutum (strain FP-91666) TaxID=721885 RepID=UPI000440ABF5|nr:uncharacterized protein STEHIDRAFT_128208 [Stereum hirsutum FP-91666 SS1]EIM91269.1 hypothetical protein STEHIDRAFT_128208 [Stereum hirsutum FP-91666 SS1]
MAPATRLAALAALLGFFVWRNGHSVKFLFQSNDLPIAYFSGGSHETGCSIVKDEVRNELRYCEDETFWDLVNPLSGTLEDRLLILSCDPGRKQWNTVMGPLKNPDPHGALWVYPTRSARVSESKPRKIEFKGYPDGHDFHPLGVEVYPATSPKDESYMYVVNHGRAKTTIEQFTMSWSDPTVATHVRTLSSPHFVSPNSIALTSPTSFYVTNDHYFTRRLPGFLGKTLPLIETVLGLPLSWVAHVSIIGTAEDSAFTVEHKVAASNLAFANGISISSSGSTVAVATTALGEVLLYTRDVATNGLTYSSRIPVPFYPDNVAFSHSHSRTPAGAEDVPIITGHPDFPALIRVAESVTGAVAPSWVLSLTPTPQPEIILPSSPGSIVAPKEYDMEAPLSASKKARGVSSHVARTMYQSNGTGFSGSTTGLWDALADGDGKTKVKGKLYVTGLYHEGFMICVET